MCLDALTLQASGDPLRLCGHVDGLPSHALARVLHRPRARWSTVLCAARCQRSTTHVVILSLRRISQPALAVCEILRELRMTMGVACPSSRAAYVCLWSCERCEDTCHTEACRTTYRGRPVDRHSACRTNLGCPALVSGHNPGAREGCVCAAGPTGAGQLCAVRRIRPHRAAPTVPFHRSRGTRAAPGQSALALVSLRGWASRRWEGAHAGRSPRSAMTVTVTLVDRRIAQPAPGARQRVGPEWRRQG